MFSIVLKATFDDTSGTYSRLYNISVNITNYAYITGTGDIKLPSATDLCNILVRNGALPGGQENTWKINNTDYDTTLYVYTLNQIDG
jgi:hypothetical protein